MLVFGHAGLALGATLLAGAILDRVGLLPERGDPPLDPAPPSPGIWLSLARRLDLRLILLGSLLPDLIDKPIGRYLFRETFYNGRIFAHTLLFSLLLALAGYWLYRKRRQAWLSVLALGSLFHLAGDLMWLAPQTFFWPLFGWGFPIGGEGDWLEGLFNALLHEPGVYLSELVGLGVLAWFLSVLMRRGLVYAFIIRGKLR